MQTWNSLERWFFVVWLALTALTESLTIRRRWNQLFKQLNKCNNDSSGRDFINVKYETSANVERTINNMFVPELSSKLFKSINRRVVMVCCVFLCRIKEESLRRWSEVIVSVLSHCCLLVCWFDGLSLFAETLECMLFMHPSHFKYFGELIRILVTL